MTIESQMAELRLKVADLEHRTARQKEQIEDLEIALERKLELTPENAKTLNDAINFLNTGWKVTKWIMTVIITIGAVVVAIKNLFPHVGSQ